MRHIDTILLIINLIILALAWYQGWLARKALEVADESLRLTRRAVHLDMLPRGSVLVHVQVALEEWKNTLANQLVRIEQARLGELGALREAAAHGEREARGLLHKPMYEACPLWLQAVYGAGAQYYYQANGSFVPSLWDTASDAPKYGIDQNFGTDIVLGNMQEGLAALKRLQGIVMDLVPEVWLNCPASLSDRDFFDP